MNLLTSTHLLPGLFFFFWGGGNFLGDNHELDATISHFLHDRINTLMYNVYIKQGKQKYVHECNWNGTVKRPTTDSNEMYV